MYHMNQLSGEAPAGRMLVSSLLCFPSVILAAESRSSRENAIPEINDDPSAPILEDRALELIIKLYECVEPLEGLKILKDYAANHEYEAPFAQDLLEDISCDMKEEFIQNRTVERAQEESVEAQIPAME